MRVYTYLLKYMTGHHTLFIMVCVLKLENRTNRYFYPTNQANKTSGFEEISDIHF